MRNLIKRIFDLVLSTAVLIIVSPLFLILIIVLWLSGDHEIFYTQWRIGYQNKAFRIIKFATMVKDSPNIGTGSITLRNDPRVTKNGKFLRKSKLNELPQIINVITGDMSLVGPRPQLEADFIKFPMHIQEILYNVKPGITGIGSIVFRDEEKWISIAPGDKHEFYRQHIAPYKGELELWYQRNISFYTDLMLIFLTAWMIIASNSNLVFNVFKDLPKKPEELN